MATGQLDQVVVRELYPTEQSAWDGFVERSNAGLPMHLSGWQQIMTATYGHRCHFLLARQADQIHGVLPLFEVKSPITGHSLQSLPGAVCAETEAAALALIIAADDLARDLKADYLLLRDSRQDWPASGLENILAHKTIRRSLSADIGSVWHAIPRNMRRYVRVAKKNDNLRVVVTQPVDQSSLKDFYTTFTSFNHEAGTPPFGYSFLCNVVQAFPGSSLTSVIYFGENPVAGFFCLTLAKMIFGIWGASLPAYRDYHPTHLAYWAITEYGCQAGFADFELGRAPYPSGPVYQLYRVYRGKKPAVVQIGNPEQDTTGLSFFRRTWSKLPRWLALMIGPKIRWHMPFG
jgi:hypothetical protein